MRYLNLKSMVMAVTMGAALISLPLMADTEKAPQIKPGPNDARIAYVTAVLLEESHYTQQPFDTDMSKKFYDGYFDALDPRHENFLQSDYNEFSHYRTNLDKLTIGGHGVANLKPAYEIFERFSQRIQQHADYVRDLLKENHFKFTSDDRILLDRRHSPLPKTLDELKDLWRQRLRYEYLQEKLGMEISTTNDTLIPLPKTAPSEIAEKLQRRYDWNLRMATNADSDTILQTYLNALTHAYDPHSDYLNNAHAQDFSIGMSLALFGIGAQLTEDDGYCTIKELIPGGPADKSKQLKASDRIIAVAQTNKPPVDVVNMELDKVVQLIRGAKGTEVRLTVSPVEDRSARRIVTLIRDEIKLEDSEAKAQLIQMPDNHGGTNRVGVITLPSFYATIPAQGNENHSQPKYTSVDVEKLVNKLKSQHIDGLIIDLRSNPGGSLEEAVKFTGLFIKDGPIVQARNSDGQINVDNDPDSSVVYDGPLAVMINRFSASASEIAAAALQDYGRAVVVGDISTHGKGTVQNLNPLRPFVWPATPSATNDPGMVKITIRKFYRVSGASTQLKGVVPDIILPDILNYSTQIGETSLENPLPWDTIPSATYSKLNRVQPYLATLRENSDARLATNQDFSYIRQDIDQFQKLQADRMATINEKEAIKQRLNMISRQKLREEERGKRKPVNEKIYDLTLEHLNDPLPAPEPMIVTNNPPEPAKGTNSPSVTETNATAVVRAKPEIKPVVLDPALVETENILEDYIWLMSKNGNQIAK